MEFWPENQGQSPLYSKFGTVPGRNCTHNYHDRHQDPHYPLNYGEQQDHGRESRYWSLPGSRTGGAPQKYTNWTDQELASPSSSYFPFILDRHTQQHQDLGDREWTAAQQAAREYERGFLREAWQRRWEPCGPVRHNREVSAKRSDSNYRELEAWAARYSHSLPRRRRIEAELRGASQGLLESSRASERDSRSGTDPRVAALQQVRQSANIGESGLWCDRGGREQAPAYHLSKTPATDTSHMLDMKEKAGYQRRMFSQPPGYIAPPPYDSPHKGSPVLHHCDTSWEQKGKRQTNWSEPTIRREDVVADLQDHRKDEFTKPDGNQKGFQELEGLKHRRQETNALQASSYFSIQEKHIQPEGVLYVQQPQVLQTVESKKINEELSSKVIEGRKFRLNKKTGGMTIFCLVSRIAGTTESPSLPLCTLQTNTVLGGLRSSSDINQTHKLADEVDFRAPTLTEPANTYDGRNIKAKQETSTCVESEMLEVNISEKAETDSVSLEKVNTCDADSTFGKAVAQSVQSVKYPLWREPSITSRVETESISPCLKANSEEEDSDVLQDQERKVNPVDVEVRRLDIKTGTESEDSKGLLVIDTTCVVVVKMELIPSPKKEHVHYFNTEHSQLDTQTNVSSECVQSNSQLNQEETTDQNTLTNPHSITERPEVKLDSYLMEETAPEGQSDISFCCMFSSSVSEKETQQPKDASSLLNSCLDDQEIEPSQIKVNDIDDAVEQIPKDTREEEQSQNQLEVDQTEEAVCLQENDDTKDQVPNEGGGDFAGLQDQVSNTSEEKDIVSQLNIDIKPEPEIEMNEDPLLKPPSEEGTTEQEDIYTSSHHSQCLTKPSNLSDSSSFSPSPHCEAPNPAFSVMPSSSDLTPFMHISESNKEELPDPELISLNSAENLALQPETSSPTHTPPLLHSRSASSTPHTDHSPSPSPLDCFVVEDHDEEVETSHVINSEISEALQDFAKDMTEELVSQQQFESDQPDDVCVKENNVTDEQKTKEVDKDPTDHITEQTLNISIEDAIEVDILQQQHECVQAEDVACVKESYMTEEQLPKEDKEDPTVLEQTISQEKVTDSQTETKVNYLPQQCDNEEQSFITEEQPRKEADEEQKLSTENATDSQTQIDMEILQHVEPQTEHSNSSPPSSSDSDFDVFQSPLEVFSPSDFPSPPHMSNESDTELVYPLHSVCPSALNPDAGIKETDPPFLYSDSCEESLQYSSSSCTDSSPVLPSSSSTPPPQEEGGGVDPNLPLEEEPQYPKSLWDAVNRIRKHTAPDSENEEEEVSELWDPESVGEGLCCLNVVAGKYSKRIVIDGVKQQAASTEQSVEDDVELGQNQEDLCYEEPAGHAEEDTLSCSSTSSHGSGDTIIVADEDEVEETPPDEDEVEETPPDEDEVEETPPETAPDEKEVEETPPETPPDEDEVEETPPDAWTEGKTRNEDGFQAAEGKRCCSAEVKDETAAKEEGDSDGDESTTNVYSQSKDHQVEVVNKTTKTEEMTETEREENQQVVFMPSEVSDEGMIQSESTG